MKNESKKILIKYSVPVLRILIGLAFFVSGLLKVIDLKAFQRIVISLGLLNGPLPLLASIIIPVLELILGIMLVIGVFTRIAAIHLNVVIIIFSWVTFYVLENRPDLLCGCFGTFFDMTFGVYHFIALFIFFILNLILIVQSGDTWSLEKMFKERIPKNKKMLIGEILIYVLFAVGIILIGFAVYINFWGQRQQENIQDITDVQIEEDAAIADTEDDRVAEEIIIVDIIDITVDQAYEAYLSDEGYIFVDVRSESEYESGHIKGAVLIPLSDIDERLNELPKDSPIVLYCNGSSCNRSGAAASILIENGFEKVYDMGGTGIFEWIGKGYPSE